MMNELNNDKNLREAVNRREKKLQPVSDDLNNRLLQRLEEELSPAKHKPLWLYAAVAAAACIALFLVFHFTQEQSSQQPVVAQQMEEQAPQQQAESTAEVTEPVEASEPVDETPEPVVEEPKSVKKQRKVVMLLVELIPTSEAKSDNVKSLPESLIAKVKAYDKQSDLSRMTGIDDPDSLVEMAYQMDNTVSLMTMAAQVEDIRQRGMRLHEEIRQQMKY